MDDGRRAGSRAAGQAGRRGPRARSPATWAVVTGGLAALFLAANIPLTVAAFAARLKDAVDLDSVRADLAAVVQRTLEPAHLSVWTSRPEAPPDAADGRSP